MEPLYRTIICDLDVVQEYMKRKERPLFNFIIDGDSEGALSFLDTIDDVNQTWIAGQTFVNCSTENNNYQVTRRLLEMGADPDFITDICSCPLVNAIKNGNVDMVEVLLEYNADIGVFYFFFDSLVEYGDSKLTGDFLAGCSLEQLLSLRSSHELNQECTDLLDPIVNEIRDNITSQIPVDIYIWEQLLPYIQ
jgi:ankyrin repeat protein